jgi:glycosyltransferase involved in cell wall biosynthesis
MKILQVINSLATGGAEKLLLESIPIYNQKGIKVDILLLNGAELPFLKELTQKRCCTIYCLGKGSVYNPLLIFKLIPYLKKYEIVHVHLFPAFYFVALAKLFSNSKNSLVYTEHCTSNKRLDSKLLSFIDKKIYHFYDKLICISDEILHIIKKHTSLVQNRFQLIENGISLSDINIALPIPKNKISSQISNTDKILIQVAGFRKQKDQQTLIKALKYLPLHVKLILVGDGVLKFECENLVNKLELQDRVFFLGLRMDVPQLLKTADIIVLSSKYEGLSLSSIEGMASGKPFVASNVPGLREIVAGAGLLFEESNEEDLASKINHLLDNQTFYDETVDNCMIRAMQYDICYMVEKQIELYKSL